MPYSEQTWNDGEAGGTPVSAARLTHMETGIGDALEAASNLSDVGSASTARTNLGLGNSATLNTGTTAGTVATGDHNHTGVYSAVGHTHAGTDITSGTVATARLDTGTSGTQVALGNHTHAGAWSDATLGTNVSAGTAVNPGTRLEGDRVFMRGDLSWSSATLNAGHVLCTVAVAHRPSSAKRFSIRTSPTSNVSSVLNLATNGQLTNVSGFGSSTTADCPIDGLSYDLA